MKRTCFLFNNTLFGINCFNTISVFTSVLLIMVLLMGKTFAQSDVELNLGVSKVILDKTGRLISLSTPDDKNILDVSKPSFLLMLQPHGEGEKPLKPISLKVAKVDGGKTQLTFVYEKGFTATVEAIDKQDYMRLEIRGVSPLEKVVRVTWGPINTKMKEPLGGYLGMIRNAEFTIGMLSLDPNTDGLIRNGGHYHVATFNGTDGSRLLAESWDHTKTGVEQDGYLAQAFPVTVKGSSIALFGCKRKDELDRVETVVLNEKLPYPTINGVWNKRSDHHILPQLWVHYTRDNLDDYLRLSKVFGATSIANFHDLFGNWGHFVPNPKLYPMGLADFRNVVEKSSAVGIDHVMYTLSTFLTNRNGVDEPFISPEFNKDMQYIAPVGALQESLNEKTDRIVLKSKPGLLESINKTNYIRIGGELIARKGRAEVSNGVIVINATRGAMNTKVTPHSANTHIFCIQQHFMNSFCPGTIELQDSVTDNLVRVAKAGGFPQVTIDGYESCLRTGHGAYAKNRFSSRLYEKIDNPELRITPSNFGNYDWHLMSYVSWGELDRERGFRGTMLDYRLRRAMELKNSLMPGKLGQYYPDDAESPEDFHWLMGLATGWGAGVDFHINKANPDNPKIRSYGEVVSLWTEARRKGFFTEKQLMELRETDRQYSLARNGEGGYRLDFLGRWIHPKMQVLPSSVFKIQPTTNAKVKASSIDWSWTHNPGIYVKAGVSDDLVAVINGKEATWDVTYPADDRLYFVIRVPSDAPGAVRNPTVILNGTRMVIPVTLQPGEYLSTPHDGARVGIYNSNHEIVREAYISCLEYRLPAVKGEELQRVSLTAESVDSRKAPSIYMNLRVREAIPSRVGEF